MSTLRAAFEERRPTDRQLRYVGAALAYVAALTHLFHPQHGLNRLVILLATGNANLLVTDPRPVLFVLSGLAVLAGVQLVFLGYLKRAIYLAGMALMATYLLGYLAWHMTGHGGFLPGRLPQYHGLGPIEAVVLHLQTYPIARVTLAAEVSLLVVLAVLYHREFR